jgi:hypothetical protein
MYNAKGDLCCSVGFRGYLGGLEAIWVISESELASTWEAITIISRDEIIEIANKQRASRGDEIKNKWY